MQEIAYRRPYEVLLLCQPLSTAQQAAVPEKHHAADCGCEQDFNVPTSLSSEQAGKPLLDLVIIAVPGQHSRKPHVGRLLAPHLPKQPSCLEVSHGHLVIAPWGPAQ